MRKQKHNKNRDFDDPGLLQKVMQQLLEQISKRDQKIGWLNAENVAVQRTLTTQAAERERALTVQMTEQERILKAQLAEQERVFKAQIAERERSFKARMTEQSRSLKAQMTEREWIQKEELTAQKMEKEQALQTLSSQIAERNQALQTLSSQMMEKEQILSSIRTQLSGRNFELAEIKASKIWRLGLFIRRVRLAAFPPSSFQTRMARRVFNITVVPIMVIAKNIKSKKDLALLGASDLFDAGWYLDNNPDIAQKNIDPASHYLHYGGFQGRDPSPLFSSSSYLSTYSDVKEAGINPLIHFIKFGRSEGRSGAPIHASVNDNASGKNSSYYPRVTIVVPNFNHASYLEKRLSSIYNQSYKNYEVLLLDDCSSDRSRKILEEYQGRYPSITRCLFNEINSGSAFAQWKKGIENAKSELVWIAESDDFCDLDFLEKMVPSFADETVLLGYAHSVFVDENSQKHPFAFEHYLSEIDRYKWEASYVASAHNEVSSSLGLKNTIPNVSSVVFRRPKGNIPILNDQNWLKMKVCGDWLFYLNIIRGGRVAYCRETNNYYRIHQSSSSKKTHVQDVYYREHEIVACAIATLYKVSDELLFKNYLLLEKFYVNTVKGGDIQRFKSLFDIEKIRGCKSKRTPNILMGVFAFSFGGGEVFPIRLANVIKEKGGSVVILNGGFEPTHPKVRGMIHPQIPVINYDPTMDLNEIAKEYGVEITHSHHASMDRMLSVYVNSKHVTTMHGMYEMMEDFLNNTREFVRQIDHWFYTADKNLAPFRKYKIFSANNFTKMDNGMRIPEIHQADLSQYGIDENSFTICLATRALFDKGWFEAIESITIARKATGRDIHLLLIGEGPVYDKLKATQLPDYIHLLGFKSHLVDYFASSQIGFLPSYFKGESFPLVMIECFMAEKPVIASKIGEIPDMITTDDDRVGGALVKLHKGKVRPEDLASALIKMVNNKDYYQECVESVKILKNKFDLDSIAEKYLEVYRKLCIHSDGEA
ncbi:MAG: glycosyltransferase [Chloroflexi bacterium]|nr:glycosyltransferase [Chloroflexota bacterium]